jgi:hypothetical protein
MNLTDQNKYYNLAHLVEILSIALAFIFTIFWMFSVFLAGIAALSQPTETDPIYRTVFPQELMQFIYHRLFSHTLLVFLIIISLFGIALLSNEIKNKIHKQNSHQL